MKEATGELNVSVVVITAVGILMAFFYYTIWPIINNGMDYRTKCSKAYCEKCTESDGCSTVNCTYKDASGEEHDITCVWKG